MITKILIALAVLLVVFLIIVALQPSSFRIERSTKISASPADVFPLVNDLHKAHTWSPWIKMDPEAKVVFEGPSSGVGAASAWSGSKLGEGRQTIIESRANDLVRLRLDFKKPFESTSTTEFVMKPDGAQTVVTWSIFGENNFISKAFCLVMSQDKMIGGPFEQGLADLKALAETSPKK